MSANFKTIAIIGGTSGLGEGLVRRYHAEGKKIIATGRRLEKLQSLQKELRDLDIQHMDVSNISSLPSQVDELLKSHPDIDTIIAMSGIQKSFDFKDRSSSSAESIQEEINTNLVSPTVLAQISIPFLLKKAPQPTTFMLVSSGLAFIPLPMYPVYCPTKAAIHSLAITLRAQLSGSNVRVVELAPPYVDTALDAAHRGEIVEKQGGEDKAVKPMGLEEYLDATMAGLKDEGKKEVSVGFAEMGVKKWREAFGETLKMMGVDA